MGSFINRNVPFPTKKPTFEPSVPDLSLLINAPPQNTYKNWRSGNVNEDSVFSRKQVRFDRPQQGNSPINTEGNNVPKVEKVFNCKQFQEIYMGNIPNRQLDLSLLDLVKTKTPELEHKIVENIPVEEEVTPKLPRTYKEFLDMQSKNEKIQTESNDPVVTDIFNYNSPKAVEIPVSCGKERFSSLKKKLVEKCDSSIQTSFIESREIAQRTKDEPTVKDLLKIIQQQNEQLLLLQKQVASLLDTKEKRKLENEPLPKQIEEPTGAGSTPKKGQLSKFSIDLMTSFEVSIRPQNHRKQQQYRDFMVEPKIREITEDEYIKAPKMMNETSLRLQDPICVRETCPSPEPSINIDMKDFDGSDDEENRPEEEECSEIGASFYENLMEQVNKIINNAQKNSKDEAFKEKTLSRVKDATVKHLKKMGLNFSTIDEVSTPNCSSNEGNTTADQVSFVVKQLLMKYLPDDKLAKLTTNQNDLPSKKNVQEKIVLNSRAPEFSFATIQFMKKYNLISGNDMRKTNRKLTNVRSNCPKILDITALKQQPKLL